MKCPECGAECWQEEVDVGVGTLLKPAVCLKCGWDQEEEVDKLFKQIEKAK